MGYFNVINRKKLVGYCILFLLVFFISFFVTYICMPILCDTVWLYGFSTSLSKGMMIYRDYNVVTTPLYYFIATFFLKIFGNYIISVDIFNSLLVSFVFLFMFKIIKWKSFIVFPLILVFFPNGYNLFSLFWLILILFLIEQKKDNDIIIALILGLLFITKQNIGVFLLIPYLYYSKHKLKGIFVFIIPFVVVSIYLFMNDAFYEFIDYCFLGLFDFGTKNSYLDYFAFVELFVLVYLIVKLFKSKFQDKEVFYILMFQIMMYPLSDSYHFFVTFFPVMYYFIKDKNNIYFLIIMFFAVYFFSINLFISVDFDFYDKKDILYLKNCGDLPDLMEYFHDYLDGVEYYFFTGYYSYLYKLYYNIPITIYDLWNEGNMGYNGINERFLELDEICEKNKCLFVVDSDLENNKKSQVTKFHNYIKNNYELVDVFHSFYIYSNNK